MHVYIYTVHTYVLCVYLYVLEVLGYSPQPGEVFFSLGSHDGTASMAWQYREPRAITKLSILPVPFSFTSESDAPIDIEVIIPYRHNLILSYSHSHIRRLGVLWITGTRTEGYFLSLRNSGSLKPHPLRSLFPR